MAKYKRTRQAKWDRRQLRTLTTKVRQADRDAFVDACYKTGKSPYATLRQFVLDYAYGGKAKAVRVETLNKLCHALDCQPGDLLEYRPDEEA